MSSHTQHGEVWWYVSWGTMACISVLNTLAHLPVVSGPVGSVASFLLIALSIVQIRREQPFLSKLELSLIPIALVLFAFAQVTQSLRKPSSNRGHDFGAYYVAGKLMAESPAESPYRIPLYSDGRMQFIAPVDPGSSWHAAETHYHVASSMPFIYPPLLAVMLKPLSRLSFEAGYQLWKALSVSLLLAGVALALSLGGIHVTRRLSLVLGVALFSYSPFTYDVLLGQTGTLLLFLLSASVWLMARGRTALSAFSFAFATLIKLTPVLAIPVLVLHRRWRWLACYVVWISGLLAYSVWQSSWQIHRQFWQEVLPSIGCGASVCVNYSAVAFVQELFLGTVPDTMEKAILLPPHACNVSRLVALAIYGWMLVRLYRRRSDANPVRDVIVMLLLGLAISPISWWHHFTVALLPFIYLIGRNSRRQKGLLTLLILAVGTNVISLVLFLTNQHAIQLVLASIVPILTIALSYRAFNAPALEHTRDAAPQLV
ncbi:MAG: hypothetical protein NVSMB27_45480 [Ktedonobacteraceae bacterium]